MWPHQLPAAGRGRGGERGAAGGCQRQRCVDASARQWRQLGVLAAADAGFATVVEASRAPAILLSCFFIGLPVCPQARHSSSTPNWAGVTPCELQLAPHTHRNAMCSRRGRSSSRRLMRSPPPRHCSSTCNAPAGTELAGGRDGARDEGRQPQATTAANHQPCWRLGFGSPALPRVACSRGCRGLQQLMACIREPSGEGDRHRPRRCFECCGPMCWHACIANPAHNAPFACDPCSIDWSAPLKLRRSV